MHALMYGRVRAGRFESIGEREGVAMARLHRCGTCEEQAAPQTRILFGQVVDPGPITA